MGLPEEHKNTIFIPHFPKRMITDDNVISPLPKVNLVKNKLVGKKS